VEERRVAEQLLFPIQLLHILLVFLHHIVVSHLIHGHQTLEAGVHVAVVGVVLKANDAVFKFRQALVLFGE